MNIVQATCNISVFFPFSNKLHYHILCKYLSVYFLRAPCEYVHLGLVLRLDWTSCQLSFIGTFLVCLGPPSILLFVPMIHVSHVHPPLTTGRLNTSTHVNKMAMLHLIYNRHTYVHHINITIQLFLYTSSTLLGRPAGPWTLTSGTENRSFYFFKQCTDKLIPIKKLMKMARHRPY